ncbi:MAG: DUF935 family protein [Paludibacter sp.]|nr:DUF935 family protein [Paludibacter sp.]
MNPFERIYNSIEQVVINRISNTRLFGEYYKRTDKASPIDWSKQPQNYTAKTIEDWMSAVLAATNPDDPRRGLLMRFYNSLKLDLHLMSCVDNRILPIQCAPFKFVDKSNNENTDVHELFERPWYIDLVKLVCMHTFEGTKIIEMIKLNDKLELAEVKEIPQSNFLAERGFILKEEYDTKGVEYKTGVYANYYVQIGNDYTLGLFNEIAMIVLAKKLGLGSWMSYIAKYGVPPLFIITDRMDDTRLKELHNMAMSFRSNHFVILNGNEKVELPKDSNTDGYQSFMNLNNFGDSQLSKRILGGTGITDEKSFVGSAELHERMLKYRIQVDKLIFKFYMNEEIIPRLVKLSSIYAPLANLKFDWDETETLTLAQKIQAVKDLAPYFNFDPEKLALLTGLPITTVKEITSAQKVEETQKKKPNASVKGARSYSLAPFAKSNHYVFAATWDAAISRLADQIWNGEVTPSDLDRDLVLKNYSALSKASQAAWGEDYYTDVITRQFRENLLKFSGAKANNLMQDLNALKRSVTNKDAFIAEAKKMVSLHNETWLNTESKFTANKTSTAKDFQQFVNDIDIYPNLKVRTMQDDNVRDSHAANEGVVMPVNECKNTPPFDPGCRCWLEQTTDPVTKRGLTNINPKWATNPIQTGMLFSDQHSYFEAIPLKSALKVKANTELMKQYIPYNRTIKTIGNNTVYVNDFADLSDMDENIDAAKKVADELNKDIYIRHHIEGGIVKGNKNPEFGIGNPNTLGDLKTYQGESKLDNFLQNNIKKANNQGAKYVVLDLSKAFFNRSEIQNRLFGSLKDSRNSSIDRVIIIQNDNVSQITRKQIDKKDFKSLTKLTEKAPNK